MVASLCGATPCPAPLQLSTSGAEVAYYRALLCLNQRIIAADAALVASRLGRKAAQPPAAGSGPGSRRAAATVEGGGGSGGFLIELMQPAVTAGGGATKDVQAAAPARAPPARRLRVFPSSVRLSIAHLGGPPPPPRQRRQLWSQSNMSVTAHDQVEIFHLPYGSDHADYREQLVRRWDRAGRAVGRWWRVRGKPPPTPLRRPSAAAAT